MKKRNLKHIKATGFKTPEAYFESFDDKVMSSLDSSAALTTAKDAAFKVPEHYFEKFDDRLMNRLKDAKETKVIQLRSRSSFYYIAGVAASLLLLIAVITNQKNTDELTVDIVENYLVQQDLTSYELAELLADVNVLSDDFTISESNYNEEQLESYLLENANIENIIEY